MNKPQPSSTEEFNRIVEELNSLVDAGLDEFTRARRLNELEARALDIGERDRVLGFSALGSIAAARGAQHMLRKRHDCSLQYEESVL